MSKYKPEDLKKMKEFVLRYDYKNKSEILKAIDKQNFYCLKKLKNNLKI